VGDVTPERLAEIRAIVEERTRFRDDGGFVTHSEMDLVLLLAHLDAVTSERDEARAALRQVVAACTDRTNGFGLLSRALDAAAAVLGAA
jgi:hypothetical protein